MPIQSRVAKSMKNTVFGVVGLLCNLIVSFVTRSIFIRILGVEYNGINGLFSNILSVLNMAELGFGSAIAFSLYKPLKDRDEETVTQIVYFYAKVYRIIGIFVAIVGCICIPFLQYLISEDISELSFSLNELRIYFAIYLLNTIGGYVLAYKRSIITADQNSYLVSNVDNICNISLNILQIILLYLTRNFYAYLIVMVAKTIINNLVLQIVADKRYPYLKKYKKDRLPKDKQTAIFKNVQALFLHKIGNVLVTSTSTLIISAFVSLIDAGKYSNYTMIVTNVTNFINIIFNSIVASIGNLCLDDDKKHHNEVFKRISYVSNFFAVFAFVCFVCLFNDFISIWLSDDMQFENFVVVAIALNAMITYIRKAVLAFKDGMGLFKQDWYKPLMEAVFGICLSIGLSYVLGMFGVIIGYTMTTIAIAIPIENFVLFKYGLKRNAVSHILSLFLTTALAFGLAALTYFICSFIPDGIGWFILEFFFVVIFAAGVYFLLTCRTKEFKYYCGLAKRVILKILKKEEKHTEV